MTVYPSAIRILCVGEQARARTSLDLLDVSRVVLVRRHLLRRLLGRQPSVDLVLPRLRDRNAKAVAQPRMQSNTRGKGGVLVTNAVEHTGQKAVS